MDTAFPHSGYIRPGMNGDAGYRVEGSSGMSLRDYFAGKVLAEMIRLSTDADGGWNPEVVASGAYNLADAMLRERQNNR